MGQNWATNNGTNIVAFTNYYNTTTGGVTAGSYAGKNVQVGSTLTLNGPITPNSFYLPNTAARVVTLTGSNVITSGGILVSSAATAAGTFTGGPLTSGNGQDLIVIHNGSANLTISSTITNNGPTAIGLTKSGSGNLVLQAANTYTGPTNVNAGTLTLNTSANVINGSAINLNGGGVTVAFAGAIGASSSVTINTGALTLNNGILDTVAGVSLRGGSIVGTNATSALTSTTAFDLQSGSVSATLAGSAGAVKTTAGTVTLSRVATYTGGTQVKAGTIAQGIASAFVDNITLGDAATNTGGTFDLAGFAASTANLSSAGTGANTVTNSGAAAALSMSGTATFGGVIQDGAGAISLIKGNATTVTLTGANTYSGGTTINNGILVLAGGNNRAPVTTAVSLGNAANNGTLQLGNATAAINQTVASVARTAAATSTAVKITGGYYDAAFPALLSNLTVNYTNTATPDTYIGLLGSGTAGATAASLDGHAHSSPPPPVHPILFGSDPELSQDEAKHSASGIRSGGQTEDTYEFGEPRCSPEHLATGSVPSRTNVRATACRILSPPLTRAMRAARFTFCASRTGRAARPATRTSRSPA